jgi:hypothetical protein
MRIESQEQAVKVAVAPEIDRDGRQPVVRWLSSLPGLRRDDGAAALAEALLARCDITSILQELDGSQLGGAAHGPVWAGTTPRLSIIQLAASWYQAATLLEFFAKLAAEDFAVDRVWSSDEEWQIELLCRAQRELSVSVELAWSTVSELRELREWLPILPFPGQADEGPVRRSSPEGPKVPI